MPPMKYPEAEGMSFLIIAPKDGNRHIQQADLDHTTCYNVDGGMLNGRAYLDLEVDGSCYVQYIQITEADLAYMTRMMAALKGTETGYVE